MGGSAELTAIEAELVAAAQTASRDAYAPYSNYSVGAALLFDDGAIITGSNVENASFGLSLCAETVAVARAFGEGRRGGLELVAVVGPTNENDSESVPITPCGRCRQVLNELAALGQSDPVILCVGAADIRRVQLSQLLPHAFGPAHLD